MNDTKNAAHDSKKEESKKNGNTLGETFQI